MSAAGIGQSHYVVYMCVNLSRVMCREVYILYLIQKISNIFFYWHCNCKSVFRYLTNCTIKLELYNIFAEIVK